MRTTTASRMTTARMMATTARMTSEDDNDSKDDDSKDNCEDGKDATKLAATTTAVAVVVARLVGRSVGWQGQWHGWWLCSLPLVAWRLHTVGIVQIRLGINLFWYIFYLACPDMPNRIYFIRIYSGFVLCLFWYKSGSKLFIPILVVTHCLIINNDNLIIYNPAPTIPDYL